MIETKYKNGGGKIVWSNTDIAAGLGPQGRFSSAINLRQTVPSGWAYLSNVDPSLLYGTLQPGYAPGGNFTNSSSLAGQIVAAQIINNTLSYGVDVGGKVQLIDMSGKSISSSFSHTITGTSPVGQDGIIYRHKLSGSYVNGFFYSYYNNANWNVGVYDGFASNGLSGSFSDTFMSATPATPLDISTASPADGKDVDQINAPHPLEIGADGILYIGSGRYLHCYDGNTGSSGTFSSRVLVLPQGFQIIALKKYQDQLLIAGNYYSNIAGGADGSGQALLYVWNYIDLDISQVIPLEDPYVAALFLWKGTPTVITNGKTERNGQNKIKVITGNSVQKVADFDGTLPIQRGIVVANDMLYINAGGKIVTYGNKYEPSTAINQTTSLTYTGGSGALFYYLSTETFIASSSNGSTSYCINRLESGNASAVAYGYYYEPDFLQGKIGKVKSIEVQFSSAVAGDGTMTLILLTDYGASNVTIISAVNTVASPLRKRYFFTSSGGTLPTFNSIAPEFTWAAGTTGVPAITTISLEYEEIEMPTNT